jgi:hypothetical protein
MDNYLNSKGYMLIKLAEYCKENNFKLAPLHKQLYFDLLELFNREGMVDPETDRVYLQLTLHDYANIFQKNSPGYIRSGLLALTNCNLIEYVNSDEKTNRTYLIHDVTKDEKEI